MAAGLIRPPRTSESHGQIVVSIGLPGELVVVDPDTGQESTLASIVSTAAYDTISLGADPTDMGWNPDISWTADGSAMSFRTYDSRVWIADTSGVHAAAASPTGNPCWSELSPDELYLALNSSFAHRW